MYSVLEFPKHIIIRNKSNRDSCSVKLHFNDDFTLSWSHYEKPTDWFSGSVHRRVYNAVNYSQIVGVITQDLNERWNARRPGFVCEQRNAKHKKIISHMIYDWYVKVVKSCTTIDALVSRAIFSMIGRCDSIKKLSYQDKIDILNNKYSYFLMSDRIDNNHSFRRSLKNVPGGISASIVYDASFAIKYLGMLPKDRNTWIAAATVGRRIDRYQPSETELRMIEVLKKSSPSQIKKALKIVGYSRKLDDIANKLIILLNSIMNTNGTLVAVAENYVIERREQYQNMINRALSNVPDDATWQAPFEVEGFTFLGSRDAMVAESERMEHCVASYTPWCYNGEMFVWHYQDEYGHATISVNSNLEIDQCLSENNTYTRTSDNAEKRMAKFLKERR